MPRSKGSCTRAVDRWVGEMAAQMKQLAPKQMVTVGEEGFFGTLTGGSWTWHNPNARHWKKLSNMYQKVGGAAGLGVRISHCNAALRPARPASPASES